MATSSIHGARSHSAKKRKQAPETPKNPKQEDMTISKDPASEEAKEEADDAEEEETEEVFGDSFPSNGSGIPVRIETEVLDCPICFGALYPPIHQCSNGHVVCSACCVRLTGKCAFCSQFMGLIRCLALEKVLESIKLNCPNAKFGCQAIVSYLHKEEHHESCIYTPCSCPVSSCSFQGSMTNLSQHFTDNHENSAVKFSYGRHFSVSMTDQEFLILISQDKILFLLLINCDVVVGGKTLSVICICPATEDNEFMYELSVSEHPTHLKLKSSGEMSYEWRGVHPKIVLFVPACLCSAKTRVDLFIQKVKRVCSSV